MRCEQVMKKHPECVSGSDTVQLAAQKMRSANIGFLPVCDQTTNKVIGALTDRDLALRIIADALPAGTRVADVMTPGVVSCRPTDDLDVAERKMSLHQKSRIFVTDQNERLLGVISLSDVAGQDQQKAAKTLQDVTARERRVA